MTVGVNNNWDNLGVVGTITPDAIDSPSIKVNGVNVGTGNGTVSTVSVTTANGVSGSVATATTTPAITLSLGAITPTSVAATTTRITSAAPASAVATGVAGTVTWDATHFYVCIATNTWVRGDLATW